MSLILKGGCIGLASGPVLAADLDLEALLGDSVDNYPASPVSRYPAIVEDLRLIVDDAVPAADLESVIAMPNFSRV